ncbi:MAG: YfiR family protein [bacterium]
MKHYFLSTMESLFSALLAAAWLFGATVMPVRADPGAVNEYAIKAAFVYNFIQFVEWPPSAFPDPGTLLMIGVLGTDPFGPLLDQTVKGESVKGRDLVVRRFRDVDDVKSCHVLFISKSEKEQIPLILKRLEGLPILTISELDGFADRGGVVNFYTEKNRVRFEINHESARRKGLKITSQLLCLGRIVGRESSKEVR